MCILGFRGKRDFVWGLRKEFRACLLIWAPRACDDYSTHRQRPWNWRSGFQSDDAANGGSDDAWRCPRIPGTRCHLLQRWSGSPCRYQLVRRLQKGCAPAENHGKQQSDKMIIKMFITTSLQYQCHQPLHHFFLFHVLFKDISKSTQVSLRQPCSSQNHQHKVHHLPLFNELIFWGFYVAGTGWWPSDALHRLKLKLRLQGKTWLWKANDAVMQDHLLYATHGYWSVWLNYSFLLFFFQGGHRGHLLQLGDVNQLT